MGESAGDIAERHGIRGADAVHLATAMRLRERDEPILFATWDVRLRAAAKREGLRTLPE